jgi:deoxyribonuclease-1-like protein
MKNTRLLLVSGILVALLLMSGAVHPMDEVFGQTRQVLGDFTGRLLEVVFGTSHDESSIRIASWNIENFGRAKAGDEWKMETIADILSQYDIIAVQEVSNVMEMSDEGCPRNEGDCPGDPACRLLEKALDRVLNQERNLNYSFAFSPQIRDERYLFVYRKESAELLDSWLVEDPGESSPACIIQPQRTGLMVRQPFVGRFRAGDFEFLLMNVHTSPSRNLLELDGLEHFYRQALEEEPDVIIAGDLNADCSYLKDSDEIRLEVPEYVWVVSDDSDTTSGGSDCAYDNIIFTSRTREDFTGNWGINRNVPENVSDHYLVWAEFYTGRDSG